MSETENIQAGERTQSKEVSVESFNLPSGKLICGRFEDEAGARGFWVVGYFE